MAGHNDDLTIAQWLDSITDLTDADRSAVLRNITDSKYQKASYMKETVLRKLAKKYKWQDAITDILVANLPEKKEKTSAPVPDPPALTPGEKFDLSLPQLTDAKGMAFQLPPDPTFTGDEDVVKPSSITAEGWMVLANDSGMLYGFLMNDLPGREQDVPIATKPALLWQVPRTKNFFRSDVEHQDSETRMTYTESTFRYVRKAFDEESASGSYPYCSFSASRAHEEQNAGASSRKTLHIFARYYYPRAVVTVDDCTALNPEFETAVRGALQAESVDDQYDALSEIFTQYGHAIPRVVTLGGMKTVEQLQTIDSEATEQDVKNTYKGAVTAKVLGTTSTGGYSFTDANHQAHDEQNIAASMTVKTWGGKVTADITKWPDTINTPDLWTVIDYTGLHSTIDLLPADLKKSVNDVWHSKGGATNSILGDRSAPWPSDEVQTLDSDGFVLGNLSAWDNFKFGGVAARTGPGRQATAWPALGVGSVEWLERLDRHRPLSSFCMPVRKGEGALYRVPSDTVSFPTGMGEEPFKTNLTSLSVNFIPLGSSLQTYLGAPTPGESDTSTVTLKNDGFLICTIEAAKQGDRGTVVLRQPGSNDPLKRLGCTAVHWWRSVTDQHQCFCVPIQAALGQVELIVSASFGQPKVSIWNVPLHGASLGPSEERDFNTAYPADQSDGFLVGWMESPDETRGYIFVQTAAGIEQVQSGPTVAGCSTHFYTGSDVWMTHGTFMVPIRQGTAYRGGYGVGYDPNDTLKRRLYWVPLLA